MMKKLEVIKSKYRSLAKRPLIYALVLLVLAIGAAYMTDKLVRVVGVQQMVDANDSYLKDSTEISGWMFAGLSVIKGGVAIIEGSTVVGIQAGDIVQPIYDFVDVAWKATFLSSAILFIVKTLLLLIAELGIYTMLGVFVSGALVLAVRNWKKDSRILSGIFYRIFRVLLTCVIGIYVALPLTVSCARFLSHKISRPAIQEGARVINEVSQEVESGSLRKKKPAEIVAWCKATSAKFFNKGIRFCAGFLFDCIIFPGALLFAVWVVIKKTLIGQGTGSRHTLREDIAYALKKVKRSEAG